MLFFTLALREYRARDLRNLNMDFFIQMVQK